MQRIFNALFFASNQGARTVLGGDVFLKIDQVRIPKDICKALSKSMVVNSLNYDLAEKLIREKKVKYVQKGERKIGSKFCRSVIDIGDIFHVHLMKGDWVVMNRQPTLHRSSMMEFLGGTPGRQNIQGISRCNKTFECRL